MTERKSGDRRPDRDPLGALRGDRIEDLGSRNGSDRGKTLQIRPPVLFRTPESVEPVGFSRVDGLDDFPVDLGNVDTLPSRALVEHGELHVTSSDGVGCLTPVVFPLTTVTPEFVAGPASPYRKGEG